MAAKFDEAPTVGVGTSASVALADAGMSWWDAWSAARGVGVTHPRDVSDFHANLAAAVATSGQLDPLPFTADELAAMGRPNLGTAFVRLEHLTKADV